MSRMLEKEIRYTPNLQDDDLDVLHRSDGCQKPCDDTRVKAFVDQAPHLEGGCGERTLLPPDGGYLQKAHGQRLDGGRSSD